MKMHGTKIVYEVGDWVKVTEQHCDNLAKVGLVGKITRYDPDNTASYLFRTDNIESWCEDVCLATQSEINKATEEEKIMWGQYEVEFLKRDATDVMGNIKIGCVTVTKELWDKIAKKAGWLE